MNGSAKLSSSWRFDEDGFWSGPVIYETSAPEDVVSFYYSAQGTGDRAHPSVESDYFVVPGMTTASAMSPIIPAGFAGERLNQTCWLGRGRADDPGVLQIVQWGLPVHYFCGFHMSPYSYQKTPEVNLRGAEPDELLAAFCCGLAEMPAGDLMFQTADDRCSLLLNYRSDLWGHLHGPGRLTLGGRLYWTVGPNFYEAIRRYYLGLAKAGVIQKKVNSPHKNAVALAPSFCTFGEQLARGRVDERLDEATLSGIYGGMNKSGMKVNLFVIDAKWESKWGTLEHSQERLPHFEDTLARLRSDGHYVGLWAAFMRCEDPGAQGLTPAHMLRRRDRQPFVIGEGTSKPYYILDCTQLEVQQVLQRLAKEFIGRYRPDFVKFDFGYEIPSLAVAAPKDMNWAGERFMLKAMQVIVNAMREVNPDLVVLYYSLSPLFVDYFDLTAPDDLGRSTGDFDLEANRRFFFSSLMGELGVPTWGSGGYEWLTAPEIWFDSAAIGTVGSLVSFSGPEAERMCKPETVAKYNGLTQAVRTGNRFSMIPVDVAYHGPQRGAHSSSWARIENGEVVLVALRERRLDGRKGSGKFRDLVASNTSLVVASKTSDGITRATKLAVIPYGDGGLTLKRTAGDTGYADATEHYFGGGSKTRQLSIENGRLQVALRERTEDGSVVEWVELTMLSS